MKRKSLLLKIFIYLCLIGYVGLIGVLVYQASLDGDASSEQSGAVGGEIAAAINKNEGDQTQLINPETIVINNQITEAEVGKKHQIKATVLPEDATYKSLSYATSDSAVATVSATGLIKFLKPGTVTITVSSKDYLEIKQTMEITVSKIELNDFNIDLYYENEKLEKEADVYYLNQYESYDIIYSFAPKDASLQTINYTYNKEYISISNDIIVAKKPTTEPIIISSSCDGITKEIKIFVNEIEIPVVDLIGYETNKQTIEMYVGQSIKLSKNPFEVVFNPENATNKNLKYSSDNPEIIEIEKGSIKAIGIGVALIKITYEEKNIEKEVAINVKNIIALDSEKPFDITQEYLSFDENKNIYHIRNGFSGNIVNNYTDATTYTVAVYQSSNPDIILVGEDGVFTPISIGTAMITVTIDDGYSEPLSYTIEFEVERKPFIEDLQEFFYKVRKGIGHFGAFLVLGILGSFGLLLLFDNKKWIFSIPLNIIMGFAVAALTEYIQTFVPGRHGCLEDVWLDFSGFMTSTSIITIAILLVYYCRYIKKCKKLKI